MIALFEPLSGAWNDGWPDGLGFVNVDVTVEVEVLVLGKPLPSSSTTYSITFSY